MFNGSSNQKVYLQLAAIRQHTRIKVQSISNFSCTATTFIAHRHAKRSMCRGNCLTFCLFTGLSHSSAASNQLDDSSNTFTLVVTSLYRPKPIHCNYHVGHYSGFSRISPSILNRFKPNLQA